VWKTILGQFHVDLSPSIYEKCIQGQSDIVVKNRFTLPIPVEILSRQKDSLFQGLIEKVHIVEGAIDFLNKAFHQGIPIVVVTNCNRQSAEQIMTYFGLSRFIHGLVIGNECCNPKPFADPYYYAIEKVLQIPAQQCIILEDSKTGVLSASSCNVRLIVGIETTYPAKQLLDLGCDMTIKTFIDAYEPVMKAYHESHKTGLTKPFDGYLNSVLEALYEKFPNYSIRVSDYKLKGGFISDVISLTILPHFNYVLKLENKSDNPIKVMAEQLNLYDTEYYFYTNIAPFLSVADVHVPTSFGVIQKGQNIRGIVLENMYSKGYIIHGTLDHKALFGVATTFIWTLSRLHISFWGADLKSLFPGLKTPMDHEFSWGDFIQTRWNLFHEKWGFMMTDSILETCKYIVDNFYEIEEYMCEGKNRTLCHGDFKAPNIFYHPETTKCCLIDWQYVTYGKGAQDLVFFMIESFETDCMTSAFKEYLLSYYYLLVAQEHPEYDHEQFRRDVRMSAFYFPFFVAIWFGTMDQDSLLDKNFPFFFIQRLFHFYSLL
jgi:beta-phosphoglucomutase-like phosphatase (HAD superfamily)